MLKRESVFVHEKVVCAFGVYCTGQCKASRVVVTASFEVAFRHSSKYAMSKQAC